MRRCWSPRRLTVPVVLLSVAAVAAACAGAEPDESGSAPSGLDRRGTSTPPGATSATTREPTVDLQLALPIDARVGTTVERIEQLGSADVEVDVVSLDSGEVTVASDRSGQPAFSLPAFQDVPNPPRAAIRVTPLNHALTPGDRDFTMSAEARLDAKSTGNPVDNGDNLLQRGLASDESQFKIELDNARPMCRLQGSDGAVEVRANERVTRGVWYRIACARSGDLLTLSVTTLAGVGSHEVQSRETTGAVGAITWSEANPPLSVGAKFAPGGELIRSATDQFNGQVANPVVDIDD